MPSPFAPIYIAPIIYVTLSKLLYFSGFQFYHFCNWSHNSCRIALLGGLKELIDAKRVERRAAYGESSTNIHPEINGADSPGLGPVRAGAVSSSRGDFRGAWGELGP